MFLSTAPVRNPTPQDLALGLQRLDRSGYVLDGDLRIYPMLVEEVDAVGAQPLEHSLDDQLDVVRAAVESWTALAGLEVDVPAELGCNCNLASERRDALAKDALDLMRAIRLGGIEEGLLSLPFLRPDQVTDSLHAYQL